jgi:hypothetical protein
MSLRHAAGLGLLLLSIFGAALFGTYLIANAVSGVTFTWLPQWLSREVAGGLLIGGFVSAYLLMRGKPKLNNPSLNDLNLLRKKEEQPVAERRPPGEPDYAKISEAWKNPPEEKGSSLESLLSAALVNALSADINITLNLPPNTKLPLLGHDWDVGGATLTIGKKNPGESRPTPPPEKPADDILTRLKQLDAEKETPPQ